MKRQVLKIYGYTTNNDATSVAASQREISTDAVAKMIPMRSQITPIISR